MEEYDGPNKKEGGGNGKKQPKEDNKAASTQSIGSVNNFSYPQNYPTYPQNYGSGPYGMWSQMAMGNPWYYYNYQQQPQSQLQPQPQPQPQPQLQPQMQKQTAQANSYLSEAISSAPWHNPKKASLGNEAPKAVVATTLASASVPNRSGPISISEKITPKLPASSSGKGKPKLPASSGEKIESKSPVTGQSTNNWSPSVRKFVERAFSKCLNSSEKDEMESLLREKIKTCITKGSMDSLNWDSESLPELAREARDRVQGNIGPRVERIAQVEMEHKVDRAVKSDQFSQVHPKLTKAQQKKELKLAQEERKLEQRAKRFLADEAAFRQEQEQNKLLLAQIVREPSADVLDWDEHTIIGTCQKLEKSYLRLTSAPDPATIRPLPVLKKALAMLKEKWKLTGDYGYIGDQFKSLRQDLTVQRVKNDFTVQVYEINARIAIEKGDMGEYNQCQTQLKQLYSLGLKGNQDEFLAYRLLYLLHTNNKQDITIFMSELRECQRSDPAIDHALKVRSAVALGNYSAFFRLYLIAPNMGGYIMDSFVQRERLYAIWTISKAYRPSVPLQFLTDTLSFASTVECRTWLEDINAVLISSNAGIQLDCKLSLVQMKQL